MQTFTIDSKNTYEPWSYAPSFKYSSKIIESNKTALKIIRYSVLGLAFVIIAETVKEIVKIPFKLLGNIFGLYKYSLFKAPITDNRSRDDIINNLKSIEHLTTTPILKKTLYLTSYILSFTLITYIGYSYASKYVLDVFSKIKNHF